MNFNLTSEVILKEQIFDARYHPTSDLIVACTIAGNLHLFESGVIKSEIKKHHKGSSIRRVRFTKDGHLVTIAKTVKIHDLAANQTLHTLKRDDGKPTSFYSVKPFGNNIISAGDDDGGIFVWDTRTPTEAIFSSYDCGEYISDIDGKYESRKLIVCSSGEGTLTAYDMRAMKMIEPQSELFEAGFQCLRMVDTNKKVVIGGEDGAIYVFNQNEWGHTSGKFAISNDSQNRGKCSIDCIELLPDNSTFLVGCSDGKMRAVNLWPHQVLSEKAFCKRSSLESIHLNPKEGSSQIVISGENYLNIVNFEEKDTDDEADEEEAETGGESHSEGNTTPSAVDEHEEKSNTNDEDKPNKKLKTETDDYLNTQQSLTMPSSDLESSSVLIMHVVRILAASQNDEERPIIKKNLEERLKKSEETLTQLAAKHHEELKLVMHGFNSISDNLQSSLTKMAKAKQRLLESREKLTSKLEELRRLSDESKRNEKILILLNQVEELSRVPANINELIIEQRYLDAAKLLVEKQNYIDEHFQSFDCLKDIKSELNSKREEIYRNCREKLYMVEDDLHRSEFKECLKMIDKTPEMPDLEAQSEKVENNQPTKQPLFKFSLSSHAMCFNEHIEEQVKVAKTIMSK